MGLLVAETILFVQVIQADPVRYLWMDFLYYRDLGDTWLVNGQWYLPHQLSGPHVFTQMVENLYPPIALLLFVPAAILPPVVWWLVPIAVLGFALARWRPQARAWIVLVLLLMWPRAIGAYIYGNTDMWIAAGIAAGLIWGWPVVLLALKPTFIPLALIGVRRRSTWIAGLGLAAVSLLMLPLWFDYLTAMRNLSVEWSYSMGSLPLICVPFVGWLGRTRQRDIAMHLTGSSHMVPRSSAAP
jgi:hypothetical protein